MNYFLSALLTVSGLAVSCMAGTEFKLMDNGKAVCSIVIPEKADPVERHAAEELAKFLGKISGGKPPRIGTEPVPGTWPVKLGLTQDKAVAEEGFLLEARKDGLAISGRKSIGVLYGVYGLLKKFGGIRWLAPGDEYEYFTLKPTITVPEGRLVENPAFQTYRYIGTVCMGWKSCIKDTWEWCTRNHLRIITQMEIIKQKGNTQILAENSAVSSAGGHWMKALLMGWWLDGRTPAEQAAYEEKMFQEHPEYFPLINGRRERLNGRNQPCTSNPEVIDIFVKNILRWQAPDKATPDALFQIGNDDGTGWCECENCRKLDPPEEAKNRCVSTRYWHFANDLIGRVEKECPGIRMMAWSYQNFSDPPLGTKPDPSYSQIMLSNHRRCWRHALDDKNCATNKWYYDYNRKWNETGIQGVCYEMLSAAAGFPFMPLEKNLVETIRFYWKNMKNIRGFTTEMPPPDGQYGKLYDKPEIRTCWNRMWQTMYMGYACLWNPDQDFDRMYEEINSLYYGKGWSGGMRDFRNLLTKSFLDTPGCWGYGNDGAQGKCLDKPGILEQLKGYLASAEKAAVSDRDPRALKHVRQAKDFFRDTWETSYEKYTQNYRELNAYAAKGKIRIDGILDEADWKNADVVTRFKTSGNGRPAKYQTAVRITYDSDNLYLGFECLEPAPGKLKTTVSAQGGPVWEDNDLEVFLNNPILGAAYFQLCFNAKGVLNDAFCQSPKQRDESFTSGAEIKTSFAGDRWFAEMRIPVAPILGNKLKKGEILKINIMRSRVTNGGERESSTWSMGMPWVIENAHAVSFSTERAVSGGSRREADTRLWKNGSFNELAGKPVIPAHWTVKDGKVPAWWFLSNAAQYGGELEMILHPESRNNYFVRLRKGFIFQTCGILSDRVRVTYRIRGKGKIVFCVMRYKNGKFLKTEVIRNEEVNTPQWESRTFEFARPGQKEENHSFMLWPASGEIDLDDVFLTDAAPDSTRK